MSEFTVDLGLFVEGELPPDTVLAEGALDSQVGKTVPVFVGEGENRREVGEALIFKEGDHVAASIRLTPPEQNT